MITGFVVDYELAEIMAHLQRVAMQEIISWETSIKASPDPLVMRDYFLLGHHAGVASYADELGRMMGLSRSEATLVYYAAMLHDWGKVGHPMYWHNRPFTEEEHVLKHQHPNDSRYRMQLHYPARISEEVRLELLKAELFVQFHHLPEVLVESLPPELESVRNEMERGAFLIHWADILQGRKEKRYDRPQLTDDQLFREIRHDLNLPRYKVFGPLKEGMLRGLAVVGLATFAA